jgi:ribosomal-protein-alanine N-acetyltransferase
MRPLLLARNADLTPLAAIHAAAFAQSWTQRALAELLAARGTFAFRTQSGFILARVAAGEAEILTLAVRPDQRRRGTGAALVCAAAEYALARGAVEIFLEVASGNLVAQGLYAELGFVTVGRRSGYYAIGPDEREDALILRSKLPLSPLGKSPGAG